MKKALALLSGGLDSTLAIKVILEQGLEVEAVNFFTPFCCCSRKSGCAGYQAKKAADKFGVKLKVFNIGSEYIQIIKNPKFGYGKNLNPCIDCRIMMHKKAKQYMQQIGAAFIITGEVLGQRPMSQHQQALNIIDRESDLVGLVLRPLSARLMPQTVPEQEGWVDRERLLEVSGRSRKIQMAMAKNYEINDYPCPAGGCLLTDAGFSRRMKDLMEHSEVTINEIKLLKVGRHFRLSPVCKLAVGRDERDNEKLLSLLSKGDICLQARKISGPIGIGRGNFDKTTIKDAAQIIARYSDSAQTEKTEVVIEDSARKKIDSVKVNSMDGNQLEGLRI